LNGARLGWIGALQNKDPGTDGRDRGLAARQFHATRANRNSRVSRRCRSRNDEVDLRSTSGDESARYAIYRHLIWRLRKTSEGTGERSRRDSLIDTKACAIHGDYVARRSRWNATHPPQDRRERRIISREKVR